jgi:hypothetical protein
VNVLIIDLLISDLVQLKQSFLFVFAGQKKIVNVWRFLAEDTIDTTIFAQRSSRVIPDASN